MDNSIGVVCEVCRETIHSYIKRLIWNKEYFFCQPRNKSCWKTFVAQNFSK